MSVPVSTLIKEKKYIELLDSYQELFLRVDAINQELLSGICDNARTLCENLSIIAGIFSSIMLPTAMLKTELEVKENKYFKEKRSTEEGVKVTHLKRIFCVEEEPLVKAVTVFESYLTVTEKLISVMQSLLKTYNQEYHIRETH